jgi:ankyrin repeat protein
VVEFLLGKGALAEATDNEGSSPLHFFGEYCKKNLGATLKALLDAGADLAARDRGGATPLERAVARGNWGAAGALVEAMDLSALDEQGGTALHYGVRKHDPKVVKVLLEHGAPINIRDAQGNTPLDVAVMIDNEKIIKLLREWGGKVTREHKRGKPEPRVSEAEFLREIEQVVAEGGDVNAPYMGNIIPLQEAVIWGYTEAVEYLLSRGADADIQDEKGWTPLHLAAMDAREDIAKMLINEGAEVNARGTSYGFTPLDLSVTPSDQSLPLIELLLDAGADVNAEGPFGGWTPLHKAANLRNLRAAQLLLNRGANANARDERGETPLHLAAVTGEVGMVKLLLIRGAEVNRKQNEGLTALDYAVSEGPRARAVVDVLSEHGGKSFRPKP